MNAVCFKFEHDSNGWDGGRVQKMSQMGLEADEGWLYSWVSWKRGILNRSIFNY